MISIDPQISPGNFKLVEMLTITTLTHTYSVAFRFNALKAKTLV